MRTEPEEAAFAAAWMDKSTACATYGLTKREYFAALAMQGLLANQHSFAASENSKQAIEIVAVSFADGLIDALNAKGEGK